MSMIIKDSKGIRRVVGFPNELTDGEPGSLEQAETIKFTPPEPDGSNKYNRINFLIKLEDHMEKMEDRFRELQAQRTMRRKFESDAGIPCSPFRQRHKFVRKPTFEDTDLPDESTQRVANLLWWRDLPDLTIADLARDDHTAAHELVRHQWD